MSEMCLNTKIFLDFSHLESLDRKGDVKFFHDAQWTKRKEVILGYFAINKALKAFSQEWFIISKC